MFTKLAKHDDDKGRGDEGEIVGFEVFKADGNSADFGERKRNFVGQHFWGRRYFVPTVGRDEALIREYIRYQEREDQ